MHVLQYIAVEADDTENAADVAQRLLEEEMGSGDSPSTWFDWFVVGGGRWNPDQDPYNNSSNMVISFDKDPNGFRAKIDECIQARVAEYNNYLSEAKQADIMSILENYGGTMSYSHDTYAFSRLIAFQQGNWDYDSKFFDYTSWSTNATHILSKLDNEQGKNFYLVPIDFHF